MSQVRHYGPSVLLLLTIITAFIAGPHLMRELAHAQTTGRLTATAEALENGPLGELNQSFRLIADHMKPSTVHVSVQRRGGPNMDQLDQLPPELREYYRRRFDLPEEDDQFREYNPYRPFGNGSGWVYDEKGHIVTNYHVIAEAEKIEIHFADKRVREATVVGTDPNTDVAVLKIDDDRLHPAELAPRSPDQGELVFAFGSPFGERFSFSMSQGIVSGKGRTLDMLGPGGYENFIQTDAAINPGNSGGPLTNIRGQVVGMNTAIATRTGGYQGIGFAIPVDMLRTIIPQLIEHGSVRRGYVGVEIRDDPRLLRTYGVDHGVVVENVMKDSPADDAGLRRGDVILEVDDQKMRDASHLRRTIAARGPDAKVELTILRNGDRKTLEVTLTELPTDLTAQRPRLPEDDRGDRKMELARKLGIEEATALTDRLARQLRLDDEDVDEGVMVERVRRGSVAAAEGITRGTIILDIQGEPVEDVDDLIDELDKHALTDGVRVTVLVRGPQGWQKRFVVLELAEE